MKRWMLAFALMAFLSAAAFAADSTGTLTVSSNIIASCTVGNPTLAFGNYDPTGSNASSPKDANTTLYITCTSGTSAAVSLAEGQNPGEGSTAAAPLRRLKYSTGGTDYFLAYNLYYDTAGGNVWGSTGQSFLGSGSQGSMTIHGRISSGQSSAVPGNYSDQVTITVSY